MREVHVVLYANEDKESWTIYAEENGFEGRIATGLWEDIKDMTLAECLGDVGSPSKERDD